MFQTNGALGERQCRMGMPILYLKRYSSAEFYEGSAFMMLRLITACVLIATLTMTPRSVHEYMLAVTSSSGTISFCLSEQSTLYIPPAGSPYRMCNRTIDPVPAHDTAPGDKGPGTLLVAYRAPLGMTLGQAAKLKSMASYPYRLLVVSFTLFSRSSHATWEQVMDSSTADTYPAAHSVSAVFRRAPLQAGPLMADMRAGLLTAGVYKIVATVHDILYDMATNQHYLATRYFRVVGSPGKPPTTPTPQGSGVPQLIRLAQEQIGTARELEVGVRGNLFYSSDVASSGSLYLGRKGGQWEIYAKSNPSTQAMPSQIFTSGHYCSEKGGNWQCVAQSNIGWPVVVFLPDALNSDSGPWKADGTVQCGRHMCQAFLQLLVPTTNGDAVPPGSIHASTRFLRAVIDPVTNRPVEVQGGFLVDLQSHHVNALGTDTFSNWNDKRILRYIPHVAGLPDAVR